MGYLPINIKQSLFTNKEGQKWKNSSLLKNETATSKK